MLPFPIPTSNVVKNTAKTIIKRNPVFIMMNGLFLLAVFFLTQILFTGILSQLFEKSILLKILAFLLLNIMVFWPVCMGALRSYWVLTEQNEHSLESVFYYFSNITRYKRAVKTIALLLLKVFLTGVICLIPCFISSLLGNSWIYTALNSDVPLWTANLQLITDFLKISGIIVTVGISLKNYLVPIVAIMDESLYLMETIHISEMISKHSLGSFASLIVSFLGWFFFSLLGIPLIYALPYFLISYVVHCRFAIVNYNLNLEQVLR